MQSNSVLASIGIIIASVAALASTTQAFVSYSVRNHPIKAQIISQIVQRCGESISLGNDLKGETAALVLSFAVGRTPNHGETEKAIKVSSQLEDTMRLLLILLDTLKPDTSTSLVNQQHLMRPLFEKIIIDKIDKDTAQELLRITEQIQGELTNHCSTILRTAL
jgi:hypothetical protein